jgi:polar amino acid transport system permease protein
MEAARSLGMTYPQAMRYIILPQAIRRVLPPLGNDFIACLKDSSLLTVVAVNELTQLGRLRRSSTFRVFEAFNVLTFLYLAMTMTLSGVVRAVERKMKIEE